MHCAPPTPTTLVAAGTSGQLRGHFVIGTIVTSAPVSINIDSTKDCPLGCLNVTLSSGFPLAISIANNTFGTPVDPKPPCPRTIECALGTHA